LFYGEGWPKWRNLTLKKAVPFLLKARSAPATGPIRMATKALYHRNRRRQYGYARQPPRSAVTQVTSTARQRPEKAAQQPEPHEQPARTEPLKRGMTFPSEVVSRQSSVVSRQSSVVSRQSSVVSRQSSDINCELDHSASKMTGN
jgi:hypothetical protein